MLFLGTPSVSYGADCSVVSATFNPYTGQSTLAQDGWFKEATRVTKNKVAISIKTANCAGKTISVTLSGYQDSLNDQTGGWLPSFSRDVDVLNDKDYVVPSLEQFDINLVAGEESCKINILPWNAGIAGHADCQFFLSVSTGIASFNYPSRDKQQGNLDYECDGGCEENGDVKWLYAGDTSTIPYPADPAVTAPPNTVVTTGEKGAIDTTSTCYDKETNSMKPDCYAIYSGLSDILKVGGNKLTAVRDAVTFGAFLNALIAITIGIAGVMTVLLIMYDGFTYWTAGKAGNESKVADVKGRVWKRVLGLLVLFSIYTLLRTINPDLLNLTPRINALTLDVIEHEAPKSADGTPILTGGGEPGSSNDVLAVNKNIDTYDTFFKQYASTYGRDCNLLKAVMYRESRGNPNAVSPAGAIGLMQFMPTTAKGLGYTTEDMKNPQKAIEASAKYFKGLSQYACNGKSSNGVCLASDIRYQVAAYNGGPGSNKPSTACSGKTWWECEQNSGYKETRHYASTVLANYQSLKDKGWTCN